MTVALRVLLAVAGLAAAGWAVARDGDVRACDAAARSAFTIRSAADETRVVRRIEERCRGAAVPAATANLFVRADRLAAARRLSRVAVAREPENAVGWIAAGQVAARAGDRRGLAEVRARLRELDPVSRALGD